MKLLRASSIQCPKKYYYEPKSDQTWWLNWYAQLGNTIEDLYLNTFHPNGLRQIKLTYEYNDQPIVTGTCDCMYSDLIIEVKTVSQSVIDKGKPRPKDVMQCLVYSLCTGLPVQLVYLCREPFKWEKGQPYLYTFDVSVDWNSNSHPQLKAKVANNLASVIRGNYDYENSSNDCTHCSFYYGCNRPDNCKLDSDESRFIFEVIA